MSDHFQEAVFSILFGTGLFIAGFFWLYQLRLIKNIPTSKIRSLAMGLVEVKGTVCETEEPLISPVTQRECVRYEYRVQEERGSGKNRRWVTLKAHQEGRYFYLEDDTAAVLIDNKGASIDIEESFHEQTGSFTSLSDQAKDFFEREGMDYEGLFGINKDMRITERIINPGQQLYIMGTAMDNPHVQEASASQSTDDVMISQGKHEKFFFISDKGERTLIAKLKWKTIGGLVGGAALIALGIWMLTF